MHYRLQPETSAELEKVPPGTVASSAARLGALQGEPLLYAMDGMLRYAKAYRARFDGSALADDGVLGDEWLAAAKGIRGLCNGDGAVAMELGRTTDSKDNGMIEAIFWHAIAAAGFSDADV